MDKTELLGYIASGLVLISFLMKDMKKLRIINIFGCMMFISYGILLSSIPVIITNTAIVIINIFYLQRNKKEE